jgi:hypothetical protein
LKPVKPDCHAIREIAKWSNAAEFGFESVGSVLVQCILAVRLQTIFAGRFYNVGFC